MAFIDRVVEHPGRYILTNADSGVVLGTFDLVRSEGDEYTPGTLLNANNLNTQTQLDSDVETIFTNAGMSAGTYQNEVSDALSFLADMIPDDYVVENGAKTGGTGNAKWYYRKWKSGKVEMWGQVEFAATAGSVWANNMYYHDVSISFPSGIFSAAPDKVFCMGRNSQWLVVGTTNWSTTGMNVRLMKPTNSSQIAAFSIYAVRSY